jgi:hypothetical protein
MEGKPRSRVKEGWLRRNDNIISYCNPWQCKNGKRSAHELG